MSHIVVIDPDFVFARNEICGCKNPRYLEHVSFVPIDGDSPSFKIVKNGFKKLIAPVYGDQKKALEKIKRAKDRRCELMLNFDNPLGIIVYKNSLQDEYGLTQGLELKTLFLLNPEKNSGNGFGSYRQSRNYCKANGHKPHLLYCIIKSRKFYDMRLEEWLCN